MIFKDNALQYRQELDFVLNEKLVPLTGSGLSVAHDEHDNPTVPEEDNNKTLVLDDSFTITDKTVSGDTTTYTYTRTYTSDVTDIKESGVKGTTYFEHTETYTVTITKSADEKTYDVQATGTETIAKKKKLGSTAATTIGDPVTKDNASYSGSFPNDIDERPNVSDLFNKNFEVCSEDGTVVIPASADKTGPLTQPEQVDYHFTVTVTDPDTQETTEVEHCVTFYKVADNQYVARYDDGMLSTDEHHIDYADIPFEVTNGQSVVEAFLAKADEGSITFANPKTPDEPLVLS